MDENLFKVLTAIGPDNLLTLVLMELDPPLGTKLLNTGSMVPVKWLLEKSKVVIDWPLDVSGNCP